jgi:hypothetical protein
MNAKILLLGGLSLPAIPAGAASTWVNWFNSEGTELRDFSGTLLVDSKFLGVRGDLIQLGYYTLATTGSPFAGTWVPLQNGRIGEKSVLVLGSGRFSYESPWEGTELLGGTPLAIRFYDAPVMDEATFFNAVSDSTGAWNAINSPTSLLSMTLSLADGTLIWQDWGSSNFLTTLPIPEPAGGALIVGGFFALCWLRGRRGRVGARLTLKWETTDFAESTDGLCFRRTGQLTLRMRPVEDPSRSLSVLSGRALVSIFKFTALGQGALGRTASPRSGGGHATSASRQIPA